MQIHETFRAIGRISSTTSRYCAKFFTLFVIKFWCQAAPKIPHQRRRQELNSREGLFLIGYLKGTTLPSAGYGKQLRIFFS
jgi:hypothetical protein